MSNKDSFAGELLLLVNSCKLIYSQKNSIFLYYKFGRYWVTNDELDAPNEEYSVVKEPYQFVPPCCVNRWFHKALTEAHHRLRNLRANDNAD